MKKGFTLVELAIVLVVVGILIGLALKGKSLVDAAKTRGELAKITRIENAVQTYFTKYEKLPIVSSSGNPTSLDVYNELLAEGLLSKEDFRAFDNSKYWVFIGCKSKSTGSGNSISKTWDLASIAPSANLCLYLSKEHNENQDKDGILYLDNMTGEFACRIETALDDSNAYEGRGRFITGVNITTGIGANQFVCNSQAVKDMRDVKYIYKVK